MHRNKWAIGTKTDQYPAMMNGTLISDTVITESSRWRMQIFKLRAKPIMVINSGIMII